MAASALSVSAAPEKWHILALRILLVLALLASHAVLAVESANAATPSIHGTVTDASTGAPLAGVEVWLLETYPGILEQSTVTDAAGNYSFTVPAGTYGIDVGHPGFEWFMSDIIAYNGTNAIQLDIPLQPVPPFIEVEGADRFETAVAASVEAFPFGLDPLGYRTVVIATGRNWPDALGGAALAGTLGGPVLLVDTKTVPASVLAEIDRLGAGQAIILGGTGAVGPEVETALKTKLGSPNVERIGGADRYVTANNVAARVRQELGIFYDGTAFVATGGNFPDALAAAPLAAGNYWPIYLAHPKTGLSPSTVTAMTGVTNAIILGGTGAVSTTTENALKTRFGAVNVERLAGDNRYTTAAAIAEYAVGQLLWFGWDGVGLATGTNFPDALAGGVLQGLNGSVMLLTPSNSLHPAAASALSANALEIDTITFFGGAGAISQEVRDGALQLVE